MFYQTAIYSEYRTHYLKDTACGHRHRTVGAAVKCARKRNPTQATGTLEVHVVDMDFNPVSGEKLDAVLFEIDRSALTANHRRAGQPADPNLRRTRNERALSH